MGFQSDRMYRILAGAPSRGSVAIENVLAPQRDSVIQVCDQSFLESLSFVMTNAFGTVLLSPSHARQFA